MKERWADQKHSAAYSLRLGYVHRWMECYLRQDKLRNQTLGLKGAPPPAAAASQPAPAEV